MDDGPSRLIEAGEIRLTRLETLHGEEQKGIDGDD